MKKKSSRVPWLLTWLLSLFAASQLLAQKNGEEQAQQEELGGDFCGIRTLAFSPDSSLLAAGGNGAVVALWRVADGQLLRTFEVGQGGADLVRFSPDGELLAAAGGENGGIVKIWRVADGAPVAVLHPKGPSFVEMVFSPDSQLLALMPLKNAVKQGIELWRVSDGSLLWRKDSKGLSRGLVFSADGKALLSPYGSWPEVLAFWRVEDGALLRKWALPHRLGSLAISSNSLAISSDGAYLAVSMGHDEYLFLWRFADGKLFRSFASAEETRKSSRTLFLIAGVKGGGVTPNAGKGSAPTPSPTPRPEAEPALELPKAVAEQVDCPFDRFSFGDDGRLFFLGSKRVCWFSPPYGPMRQLRIPENGIAKAVAPNGLWLGVVVDEFEVEIRVLKLPDGSLVRVLYHCVPQGC
jgi:hypothetical protein